MAFPNSQHRLVAAALSAALAAALAGCGGGTKHLTSATTLGPGGPGTTVDLGSLPTLPPETEPSSTTVPPRNASSTTTARPASTSTTVAGTASGVKGVVESSPTCPVQQANNPCPPAPTQASLKLVDGSGKVVATGQSGTNGAFSIAAPPGSYTLEATPSANGPGRGCQPDPVTIQPGKYTDTKVSCDTGIR